MTFKMFNWINERLKAQHELEFRMSTTRKYFQAPLDRLAIEINSDMDMEHLSRYITQEIKRHRPNYYNFYLFDKVTKEEFMVYDADERNKKNS